MFLPNVPGATFIPGATSIPESRVETSMSLDKLKKEHPLFVFHWYIPCAFVKSVLFMPIVKQKKNSAGPKR